MVHLNIGHRSHVIFFFNRLAKARRKTPWHVCFYNQCHLKVVLWGCMDPNIHDQETWGALRGLRCWVWKAFPQTSLLHSQPPSRFYTLFLVWLWFPHLKNGFQKYFIYYFSSFSPPPPPTFINFPTDKPSCSKGKKHAHLFNVKFYMNLISINICSLSLNWSLGKGHISTLFLV